MSKTYKKNFIHKVIFRLDFKMIDDEIWAANLDNIEKFFKNNGFKYNKNELISFVTEMNPQSPTVKTIPSYEFVVIFDDCIFKITKDSWVLEVSKYKSFDSIKEIVSKMVLLLKELKIEFVNRLGLRYINTIDLEESGLDYTEAFSHQVTAFLSGYEVDERLVRVMQSTILKRNAFNLTINHGLYNSNYPNPITRKEFALDYDATILNFESNKALDYFIEAHDDIIEKEFDQNITDKFKEFLDA
mgnify:CR=1 FL=1